ncbi:IPT/TIG domain-containing protein, partial [Flavobacterium sp.]|uniref:beta strand repeat-containing protein n=1 Tax=Flavobacterium sp. TaxID=239 RepID=UPI00333E3253
MLISLFLGIQDAIGQVAYTQNFSTTTHGWTDFSRTTSNICATTGSIRKNLYSGAATGTPTSPLLSGNNGMPLTFSYQYKVINWSGAGATPANFGSFKVQYASSTSGPWTDVPNSTINSTNHTPSTSCVTKTVTFTPSGGNLYVRFNATWSNGDYYLYFDEVAITQEAAPPCTDTPVAGTLNAATQFVCNATAPSAISLSGFSNGTGITFQWEESADGGITWNNATAGTGATTASYTPPAVSANISYRAKVTCSGSGLFSYSEAQQITVVTCTYDTSYTAGGVAYQSIMPAKGGSGLAYSGTWTSTTSGDDNTSPVTLLTGTTFKYQGQPITGFRACTNGWMTFNTASTSNAWTNDLTSTGQNLVLAPFWDDLVLTGQAYANRDACMRYFVEGTLGSGSAIITIEWSGMERYLIPGPDLNFQVKLHEQGNKIEYIYGNFKGFDGTFNSAYSYSIGMNGSVPSGTTAVNRFALQTTNYNHFDFATAPTGLVNMPNCNSKYTFTPGTYSGLTAAPTLVAPANDEPTGAFGLDIATAPTSELCGLYYHSRLATDSGKGQACATTAGNQDDDVWFAFETTAASEYSIVVRSSPLYDAVVQLFDENLTPISCVNATGSGLIETLTATNLTPDGGFYYVRVFHNGAGSSASGGSGEFSIAMNEVLYPPANDNIAGAIALNVNASCQTTSSILPNTLVATASPTTPAACNTPDDDVWYSFVATSTLNEVKVQSASGYNAAMQILSSSDNTATGTLTELVCRNNTSTGGEETYAGPFIVGQTYFVRVYHAATGVGTGNFTICVSAPTPLCAVNATPANAATTVNLTPTLTWAAATNASLYDVYLGTTSGALSLLAADIATTSYTLTNAQALLGLTNYYWYVVAKNVNGSATCTVANETSFTTPSDCLAPTALTALPTGTTTATLSWTSPAVGQTPQGYEYAVTDTNVAPTTSGTATTLNSVSVADLTSGSTYYFHVRSMCANGEMGSWVTSSAFTMPLISPVPWTEGFATTTLPEQWSNAGYFIGSFPSGNPGNAISDNLYSFSTSANFATPNLGTIATNHILTFDYKLQDYDDSSIAPTAGSGNFVVQISTNFGATYTTLETVDNDGVTGWRQKSYDLAPYAGENIKLKIIGNWISGDYYLSFDNISVSALCSGMPTAGTVSVAAQSLCPAAPVASITITGASFDAGIAYQWQQSTDNGVEWVDAIGGTGVNTLTYSPPVFAGDPILYRLRVSCTTTGEEAYSNTSQVNSNPRAVPFTETFDDIANLTGWSTAGFAVGSIRGATGNSDANAYINIWSSTPSGYLTTANYGPITAGQALRFDYQLSNWSFPYAAPAAGSGNVVVAVSSDCGATFTTLETINNDGEAGYRTKTYSLASYVGQNVVFKITGNRTSGDYDLSIDNLAVIVPAPEVASYSPATVCAGSTVTISGNYFSTVSSVKVGTTEVTFNIVNANTITFTAPSTSTGGAITVTNPGGQATSVLNLVIDNTTATITADGPTTFCSGGSVVLTASPATSYSWSTGATTQSITVNQSGNYSVSIINANRCALRSESVAVTVNPVSFETVEQSACISYTWPLSGLTYTESGDYTYVTTNSSGCPHTTTLQLTISNGAITAQPTAPTICAAIGATASISVEVSGANLPSYQWQMQTTASTTVWTNISNNANYSGATSATLNITRSSTSLPATGTKYRVLVTSCGTTVTSQQVALQQQAGVVSKATAIAIVTRLTPTATTCEGTTVDLSLAAGSIGNVQWQMSTTSATEGFTPVGSLIQQSALSAVNPLMSFTTPTLTQDTWFRIVATNGVCSSATSAAIKINVSTTPTAGTIAGGDVTVCAPQLAPSTTVFDTAGTALSSSITNSTTLSLEGTTSGATIVWERSINFVNATNATPVWSAVTNLTATTATGASYSGAGTGELVVGNLAATTWFRARVINGACSVITDEVKITVSPTAKAGTVTSPTTVCVGGSITFTSAAY